MSKSVKIPAGPDPWVCRINEKTYSYPAGTTQTVPDEVAAVIAANQAMEPKENKGDVGKFLRRTATGTEWAAVTIPQGEAVANADGDAPTAAEFKALLDSLRNAGLLKKG